jgi:nucleoside-diphosphate-sugar epimerase
MCVTCCYIECIILAALALALQYPLRSALIDIRIHKKGRRMKAKVLITGGAGYLGTVLSEHLLNAGYHVVVIDNLTYGQKPIWHLCHHPAFDFVFGDVRNENLMKAWVSKADVIIPLAATVGADACDRDPQAARDINQTAVETINKLRSSDQLMIYPNTNSGYGTKSGEVYCTEDSALEPISLYGRTKVNAEKAVLASKNAITLRLATVFGVSARMRLDLLVNHFVYAAATDGYLVIFEKDFKRNYIHIRDVADCFLHCIQNSDQMQGRPYNAGLENANLSKAELALRVKQLFPDFYIHFSEIGSDPDKRNYIVSNERLKNCGFEAKRSLDTGIAELAKGYRMMVRDPFKNV